MKLSLFYAFGISHLEAGDQCSENKKKIVQQKISGEVFNVGHKQV